MANFYILDRWAAFTMLLFFYVRTHCGSARDTERACCGRDVFFSRILQLMLLYFFLLQCLHSCLKC